MARTGRWLPAMGTLLLLATGCPVSNGASPTASDHTVGGAKKAKTLPRKPSPSPSTDGSGRGGASTAPSTAPSSVVGASPAVSAAPSASAPPLPGVGGVADPLASGFGVSVWAGGTAGTQRDATGSQAVLARNSFLVGMALDGSATPPTRLLFADQGRSPQSIRTIDLASKAVGSLNLTGSILVGTEAPAGPLISPSGLVYDASRQRFYVADAFNNRILQFTATGETTLLAGNATPTGYQDGPGAKASINEPIGLALAGDTLYVAEGGSHSIRAIALADPQFAVTTVAGGQGTSGPASTNPVSGAVARFNLPGGLAYVGGAKPRLFVADTKNHCIRSIDPASGMVSVYAGRPGQAGSLDGPVASCLFDRPTALAADGQGALYVGEAGSTGNRLRRIDPSGQTATFAQAVPKGAPGFTNIGGLLVVSKPDGSPQQIVAFDVGPVAGDTNPDKFGPRLVGIEAQ